MIKSTGDLSFDEADNANIPVNIFITEPGESETAWTLTADNFMPRKSYAHETAYAYEADSKEELVALVQKYVVPLFEAALSRLKTEGELYYWTKKEQQP